MDIIDGGVPLEPTCWQLYFEGREQCLQSQLGSVVVSRLVSVDPQNIKHVKSGSLPVFNCRVHNISADKPETHTDVNS